MFSGASVSCSVNPRMVRRHPAFHSVSEVSLSSNASGHFRSHFDMEHFCHQDEQVVARQNSSFKTLCFSHSRDNLGLVYMLVMSLCQH